MPTQAGSSHRGGVGAGPTKENKNYTRKEEMKMLYSDLIRSATAEEIAIYEKVDAALDVLSDEAVDALIEAIGDYAFSSNPAEEKKLRESLAHSAAELGVSVDELVTWYWVDED